MEVKMQIRGRVVGDSTPKIILWGIGRGRRGAGGRGQSVGKSEKAWLQCQGKLGGSPALEARCREATRRTHCVQSDKGFRLEGDCKV